MYSFFFFFFFVTNIIDIEGTKKLMCLSDSALVLFSMLLLPTPSEFTVQSKQNIAASC